jgi:hypothetical protein
VVDSAAKVNDFAQAKFSGGSVLDSGRNNLIQTYAGGLGFTATITGKNPMLGRWWCHHW